MCVIISVVYSNCRCKYFLRVNWNDRSSRRWQDWIILLPVATPQQYALLLFHFRSNTCVPSPPLYSYQAYLILYHTLLSFYSTILTLNTHYWELPTPNSTGTPSPVLLINCVLIVVFKLKYLLGPFNTHKTYLHCYYTATQIFFHTLS